MKCSFEKGIMLIWLSINQYLDDLVTSNNLIGDIVELIIYARQVVGRTDSLQEK
jgi:hypothetical protein